FSRPGLQMGRGLFTPNFPARDLPQGLRFMRAQQMAVVKMNCWLARKATRFQLHLVGRSGLRTGNISFTAKPVARQAVRSGLLQPAARGSHSWSCSRNPNKARFNFPDFPRMASGWRTHRLSPDARNST